MYDHRSVAAALAHNGYTFLLDYQQIWATDLSRDVAAAG